MWRVAAAAAGLIALAWWARRKTMLSAPLLVGAPIGSIGASQAAWEGVLYSMGAVFGAKSGAPSGTPGEALGETPGRPPGSIAAPNTAFVISSPAAPKTPGDQRTAGFAVAIPPYARKLSDVRAMRRRVAGRPAGAPAAQYGVTHGNVYPVEPAPSIARAFPGDLRSLSTPDHVPLAGGVWGGER